MVGRGAYGVAESAAYSEQWGLAVVQNVENRVRVVIAEDSVLLREGLTRLLTDLGHDVVAGVADAEALLKKVAELDAQQALPDVVVADVRMPPTHTDEGVRAAVRLRKDYPDVGVLVLSQYVEERYATELLAGSSNGVGYLLKDRVARSGSSWTPSSGWPGAARRWTRRWWLSCWAAAASRTCWSG